MCVHWLGLKVWLLFLPPTCWTGASSLGTVRTPTVRAWVMCWPVNFDLAWHLPRLWWKTVDNFPASSQMRFEKSFHSAFIYQVHQFKGYGVSWADMGVLMADNDTEIKRTAYIRHLQSFFSAIKLFVIFIIIIMFNYFYYYKTKLNN